VKKPVLKKAKNEAVAVSEVDAVAEAEKAVATNVTLLQEVYPSCYTLDACSLRVRQRNLFQKCHESGFSVRMLDNIGFGFCGDFVLMAIFWFCGLEPYSIREKLSELITIEGSSLYQHSPTRRESYIRSLGIAIPEGGKVGSIRVRDLEMDEILAVLQHQKCCNVVVMRSHRRADGTVDLSSTSALSEMILWRIDDQLPWCVLHMSTSGVREPIPTRSLLFPLPYSSL
jgi:hypothetical protein